MIDISVAVAVWPNPWPRTPVLVEAAAFDLKAFCAAPGPCADRRRVVHRSGVHDHVVVVAGGSVAKSA